MQPHAREIELKFELEPSSAEPVGKLLQLWSGGDAAPAEEELVSVYYDTPNMALRREGLSLRVRKEGGRWLQTAKSGRVSTFDRGEWEQEVEGEALDIAALSTTPVQALAQEGGGLDRLQPLFAVRVTRSRRMIRDGGNEVEASLDRGAVEAGGRTTPLCELELELKSGDPGGLFSLARTLAEAEPLRLSFQSKAERGYALLGGAAPSAVKAGPSAVTADQTVGQGLQAIGRQCLAQLSANEKVLREVRSPGALHQARVALRRYRGALSQFRDVAADERLEPIKAELKWLAKELDDARNIDVFLEETFEPARKELAEAPGMRALGEAIGKRRDLAYGRACEALASERYRELVLGSAEWLETGAWTKAQGDAAGVREQPVQDYAAAALSRLAKKMRKRGRGIVTMPDEERHEVRIVGKKLRYAAEFFIGAFESDRRARVKALLDALKPLQEILGQLNDVATGQLVASALADAAPKARQREVAFAAGLVLGRRTSGASGSVKVLKESWRRFDKAARAL